MPTPGATIAERITDLIGSEYATIPSLSYKDLINAAFNEVADLVSEDLLLKYSPAPTTVTSATGVSIEDKKILQVTRIDANGGIERECEALDRTAFDAATDSGSIYKSTVFSPVYKLHSDNAASTLVIYPDCDSSGQEGKIFYFPYATNSVDLTGIDAAELNTDHFLPSNLIHAIVLKSCANILQSYINNQVQDEEDSEMLAMVTQQLQGLEASFQNEIQRFMDESGRPGSE
tara:strand:+ start:1105 stop:1800 length:696 start_codon:yes stop_codon:yes gene_type:complete